VRFFAEEDYACFLDWLNEAARACGCAVHAYVLIDSQGSATFAVPTM